MVPCLAVILRRVDIENISAAPECKMILSQKLLWDLKLWLLQNLSKILDRVSMVKTKEVHCDLVLLGAAPEQHGWTHHTIHTLYSACFVDILTYVLSWVSYASPDGLCSWKASGEPSAECPCPNLLQKWGSEKVLGEETGGVKWAQCSQGAVTGISKSAIPASKPLIKASTVRCKGCCTNCSMTEDRKPAAFANSSSQCTYCCCKGVSSCQSRG